MDFQTHLYRYGEMEGDRAEAGFPESQPTPPSPRNPPWTTVARCFYLSAPPMADPIRQGVKKAGYAGLFSILVSWSGPSFIHRKATAVRPQELIPPCLLFLHGCAFLSQ